LAASGVNYVSNTISLRNEGNVFVFSQKNGKFEAYCIAEEKKQYGIYFPEEGVVMLNLSGTGGKW